MTSRYYNAQKARQERNMQIFLQQQDAANNLLLAQTKSFVCGLTLYNSVDSEGNLIFIAVSTSLNSQIYPESIQIVLEYNGETYYYDFLIQSSRISGTLQLPLTFPYLQQVKFRINATGSFQDKYLRAQNEADAIVDFPKRAISIKNIYYDENNSITFDLSCTKIDERTSFTQPLSNLTTFDAFTKNFSYLVYTINSDVVASVTEYNSVSLQTNETVRMQTGRYYNSGEQISLTSKQGDKYVEFRTVTGNEPRCVLSATNDPNIYRWKITGLASNNSHRIECAWNSFTNVIRVYNNKSTVFNSNSIDNYYSILNAPTCSITTFCNKRSVVIVTITNSVPKSTSTTICPDVFYEVTYFPVGSAVVTTIQRTPAQGDLYLDKLDTTKVYTISVRAYFKSSTSTPNYGTPTTVQAKAVLQTDLNRVLTMTSATNATNSSKSDVMFIWTGAAINNAAIYLNGSVVTKTTTSANLLTCTLDSITNNVYYLGDSNGNSGVFFVYRNTVAPTLTEGEYSSIPQTLLSKLESTTNITVNSQNYPISTFTSMFSIVNKTATEFINQITTLNSSTLTKVRITGETLNLSYEQYMTYPVISGRIITTFTIGGGASRWTNVKTQIGKVNNPYAMFNVFYFPEYNYTERKYVLDKGLEDKKIGSIYLENVGYRLELNFNNLDSSDKSILSKVKGVVKYGIVNCPISGLVEIKNDSLTGSFAVHDTASNLNNFIAPSYVTTIASSGTVSYDWSLSVVATIQKYISAVTVYNVPASNAADVLSNRMVSCSISDTWSNFLTKFDVLKNYTTITSLQLTGEITMTTDQYTSLKSIAALNSPFTVTLQSNKISTVASGNSYARFVVSDSAKNISSFLTQINSLTNLYRVECTGLTITYSQYTDNATAISKLINPFTVTLVSCDIASVLIASNPSSFLRVSVSDSAAKLRQTVATLQSSIITNITANDNKTFIYDYSASVLSLVLKSSNLNSVVSVPANNALAVKNGCSSKPSVTFSVSDTGGSVLEKIEALNTYTALSTITVTDNLIVPLSTFTSNLSAMSKLTTACSIYDLTVTATHANLLVFANAKISTVTVAASVVSYADLQYVSKLRSNFQLTGVPVSMIESVLSNAFVTSITVSDTSVNISSNIHILNLAKITAISCDATLTVQFSQYVSNLTVFAKFTSPVAVSNTIPCSSISTMTAPATFNISDLPSNILLSLDVLNSSQSRLSAIIASAVINFTYAQILTHSFLLNKFLSSFTVSGVPVFAVPGLASNQTLTSISVSDSAENIDSLQTSPKIAAVTVESGRLSFAAFSTFVSLLTSAVTVKNVSAENLSTLQSNFSRLSSVQNDVPLQVSVSNLSSFPNAIALLASSSQINFVLNDYASAISANLSVVQNARVTKIVLKDASITLATYQTLLTVQASLADVTISDTAAKISAFLANAPAASIVNISADATFTIGYAVFQNASKVRSNFTVSKVPIANLETVLANTNVTNVTVSDSTILFSNSIAMMNLYSNKIQSVLFTDAALVEMTMSTFRSAAFLAAMPSASISVVNASNSDLSFLNSNSLAISQIVGISVVDIATVIAYPDAIRKTGSVDVADTSTFFVQSVSNSILNASVNYIRSIDAGDVSLTLAQTQNPIVSKLALFTIAISLTPITQFNSLPAGASVNVSDTALAIQGNWSSLTTNSSKIKSIIVNDGGGIALDVVKLSSAALAKLPALSVIVTDKASNLSNLAALSTYASKIRSFSVTGTLSVSYEFFDSGLAGKLTSNYRVLNVPASAVSSIASTYASVSVRDYSYNLKTYLAALLSNISKVSAIVKIDSLPISVDAATFLTNGNVFKILRGVISDTSSNILTRLSEINTYSLTNKNSIAYVEVVNFTLPYATFTENTNVAKLMSNTFKVTGVPVSGVGTVLSTTFPKAIIEISDLLSVVFENKSDLQLKNSKITSINATNNVTIVIDKATKNAFPILNKISYS